jgi:hypothetical protein
MVGLVAAQAVLLAETVVMPEVAVEPNLPGVPVEVAQKAAPLYKVEDLPIPTVVVAVVAVGAIGAAVAVQTTILALLVVAVLDTTNPHQSLLVR